jgi:NarL family two-component system response regulator LiaR
MAFDPSAVPPRITCLLAGENNSVVPTLEERLVTDGIGVLGVARTGVEALSLLQQRPTTAIIVDLGLSDLNGLEVARRAVEIVRRQAFVILRTTAADSSIAAQALDAGARGVVLHNADHSTLLEALSRAAAGGIYVDSDLR